MIVNATSVPRKAKTKMPPMLEKKERWLSEKPESKMMGGSRSSVKMAG